MMLKLSKNAAGENANNIRLNGTDMLSDVFTKVNVDTSDPNFDLVTCTANETSYDISNISLVSNANNTQKIQLTKFPLSNIDVMREIYCKLQLHQHLK